MSQAVVALVLAVAATACGTIQPLVDRGGVETVTIGEVPDPAGPPRDLLSLDEPSGRWVLQATPSGNGSWCPVLAVPDGRTMPGPCSGGPPDELQLGGWRVGAAAAGFVSYGWGSPRLATARLLLPDGTQRDFPVGPTPDGTRTAVVLLAPSGVTDYTVVGLDPAGCEVARMLVSLTAGPEGQAPPQAC